MPLKVDSLVKRRKIPLSDLRLKTKCYSDVGRVSSLSLNNKKVEVIWNDTLPAVIEYKEELKVISDSVNDVERSRQSRLHKSACSSVILQGTRLRHPLVIGQVVLSKKKKVIKDLRQKVVVVANNVEHAELPIANNPAVGNNPVDIPNIVRIAINEDAKAFEVFLYMIYIFICKC